MIRTNANFTLGYNTEFGLNTVTTLPLCNPTRPFLSTCLSAYASSRHCLSKVPRSTDAPVTASMCAVVLRGYFLLCSTMWCQTEVCGTGTAGNGDLNVDKEDMVAVRRGNEQEETRADKAEQVGLYQGRHPKRNARRGVRCATRRPAFHLIAELASKCNPSGL